MSWINRLRDKLYGFEQRPPSVAVSPRTEPSVQSERPATFPERVLFICSGNMCRSAYAEYRFRQMISASHANTRIMSAGTLRLIGESAAPEMIAAAAERGLDLRPHRSNALSGLLVKSADRIFAMDRSHYDTLLHIDPASGHKIVMLGLYLNTPQPEIEDPMGREPEVYRRVAAQIDEALDNWLRRMDSHDS